VERLTLALDDPTRGEALSSLLEDVATSSTWFEDPRTKNWFFQAIYAPEHRPEIEALLDSESLLKQASFERVPDVDWLAENRKAFPPLEIGSFFIYGSYFEGELPQNKETFLIEASLAFGTGQHQTTKACLMALERLKNQGANPQKCLDLGCGTSILAMAAHRLFGGTVTAADNDPEAIEVSRTNLLQNGFKDKISLHVSEGFEDQALQQRAPFDLIVANILAEPLLLLAPYMARYSTPKARLILSGLLDKQESKIRTAYEEHGFVLQDKITLDEWIALTFQKL